MSIVIDKEFILTKKDHQTNVKIPFELVHSAEKLRIQFSYDPPHVEDDQARERIKQAVRKYVPEEELNKWNRWEDAERFLPLQNLVTLSLSYEGEYLGARHRKATEQEIILSKNHASKGFLKYEVIKGQWEAQLNVHCVASEKVNVSLLILTEGATKNETVPD